MEKLDESDIIEIVNYMMDNKISDYRDIDISNMPFNNNIKNKFENEEIEIFLPSFDYTILKQYNNSTIIGGGKDKCLAEIIILLNALGLKYTID
jgi:hypothetical protein